MTAPALVRASAAHADGPSRTVFRGGLLFDGSSAAPQLGDVVVEGETVVAVGPGLDGDVAVDCAGCLITPGLIDCHVHVMLSGINLLKALQSPFSMRFYEAAANLELTLRTGITTVRDAAGADLGVKQALAAGLIPGPRMEIAVGMVCQTGGHADEWFPCGEAPQLLWPSYPGNPSTVIDGPVEARRVVRQLIRAGADVIKIAASGGLVSPVSDPHAEHLCEEELAAIMAEARAAGRQVMAHAHGVRGTKNAVRAGAASIEHGIWLDDEAISLMLDHGTVLVPTLLAPIAVARLLEAGGDATDKTHASLGEILEVHADSVSRAHAAGVPIVMGSDSGVFPHGGNLEEIALLRGVGLSAIEAMVATTAGAAKLLGLGDVIGTLEVGKRADLAIFECASLTELGPVREVWQGGSQVV